ncbi:hypothetical protein [Novosphingobium sp.]|jgi:hypothetical protein|uniref:hypothetical protein n=1 Tax=Novosphingobium sp. TaxID=1874826 RepID=UPI002FE1210B
MEATMLSALTAPFLRTFQAVRIDLITTGTAINLLDASAEITFSVDGAAVKFTGIDSVFGTLGGIDSIQENIASEAPSMSLRIQPPSSGALGELSQPENQGSTVRVWVGVVDDMTGNVIGVPELLWSGRLDTVVTSVGENTLSCELKTVSGFDRLFAINEGEALNSVWHQAIWPGETGLNFNVSSVIDPMWGADATTPATTPVGSGRDVLKPSSLWK